MYLVTQVCFCMTHEQNNEDKMLHLRLPLYETVINNNFFHIKQRILHRTQFNYFNVCLLSSFLQFKDIQSELCFKYFCDIF